MSVSDSARV